MNQNMMNKLKKLQKEMMEAQEQLEHSEFVGKASGITVIMQGNRRLLDVQISEEAFQDVEILQDIILVAVNDALSQIDKKTEETMGAFQSGFGGFPF